MTVEPISTTVLLLASAPRKCVLDLNSRNQARLSTRMARTNKGIAATRNAGATAAPAEVAPSNPRTAGTTHHQGSGMTGASARSISFSNCSRVSIFSSAATVMLPARWNVKRELERPQSSDRSHQCTDYPNR